MACATLGEACWWIARGRRGEGRESPKLQDPSSRRRTELWRGSSREIPGTNPENESSLFHNSCRNRAAASNTIQKERGCPSRSMPFVVAGRIFLIPPFPFGAAAAGTAALHFVCKLPLHLVRFGAT